MRRRAILLLFGVCTGVSIVTLASAAPLGGLTEFPLAAGSAPFRIASGADGNLWFSDQGTTKSIVQMTTAGAVQRFAPDGTLDRTVEIPADDPTSCCFYDDRLVVTSRDHVWITDVGVGGPPAQPFRSAAPSDAEPTSAR